MLPGVRRRLAPMTALQQLASAVALSLLLDQTAAGQQAGQAQTPGAAAPQAPAADPGSGVPLGPAYDATEQATAPPDQARGFAQGPGVEDEDIALAVPRALLFLPRLASDLVLWPIVRGAVLAHELHLLGYAERVLYFDRQHLSGWHPTLSFSSRLGPRAGIKVFHDSVFGNQEELEASASFLGGYARAYELALRGDRIGGSRLWLHVRARHETEEVSLFGGVGIVDGSRQGTGLDPRASNRLSYFGQTRQLGLLQAGYAAGEAGSRIKPGLSLIGNRRRFRPAAKREQATEVYDTSRLVGFDGGSTTVEVQANLLADFRNHRGLDSSGTFFEAFGGRAFGLHPYRYWHWGAEALHTIDLFKRTRLLILRAAVEAVAGEAHRIPFSELPRLGGPDRMRGYQEGQFRDRIAVFAGAEYHYPIHRNIHGQLFIDAGTVAPRYSDLVERERWKVGYGAGLLFGGQESISLRFDVSYGDGVQFFLSSDLARALRDRSELL